ncbi:MAG: protein kinase [Anaerolineales bacterium]|nr:protein kinase [Anaerolineales bacterium]
MASANNQTTNDNQISRYAIEKLFAENATSAIYLAKDTQTGDSVFLVTLPFEIAKSSEAIERFLRRAETVAQLKHDTLLPISDYGLDGKRPFAIMPYRPGRFLSAKLAAKTEPAANNKATVIANLALVKQIAEGLVLAHPAGLFHHDLRPNNIYLDESGKPILLDLVIPPQPLIVSTHTQKTQPTELDYQSPEQIAGKALSGRSNIFSLGVLLYRLLAGHKPALPTSEWDIFEQIGTTREIPLDEVRTDLMPETYTAVRDSIWQQEWSRFETVEAQIEAISQAIIAESAPPPPPPPVWLKLLQTLQQPENLKYVVFAAVAIILLVIGLVFFAGRSPKEEDAAPTEAPATLPTATESSLNTEPTFTSIPPTETRVTETEAVLNATSATATETAVPTVTQAPPTATSPATPRPTLAQTTAPTSQPTATRCVSSPPLGWERYAIQANDSLSALSQAAGITVERLMAVNCLDSNLLNIGQQIWLPALPTPTLTATVAITGTATAVSGSNPSAPPAQTAIPPTSAAPPLPSAEP